MEAPSLRPSFQPCGPFPKPSLKQGPGNQLVLHSSCTALLHEGVRTPAGAGGPTASPRPGVVPASPLVDRSEKECCLGVHD